MADILKAETLTAKDVGAIQGLIPDWKEGALVSLNTAVDVNYGELGLTRPVDVWPLLDAKDKADFARIYDNIRAAINGKFLGNETPG